MAGPRVDRICGLRRLIARAGLPARIEELAVPFTAVATDLAPVLRCCSTVGISSAVLTDLRRDPPDLIVHDSACLWGAVAARELGVPAVFSFTRFGLNRPRSVRGYLRYRWALHRRFDARGLPHGTQHGRLGPRYAHTARQSVPRPPRATS
ncbi:hypothetical protein ACFZCU_26500 [Streptomyces canus]|uniref:hypothetical protein n=1 Tax=Streptomyces canus TaxID=58343 RepID=UPI0036E51B3C